MDVGIEIYGNGRTQMADAHDAVHPVHELHHLSEHHLDHRLPLGQRQLPRLNQLVALSLVSIHNNSVRVHNGHKAPSTRNCELQEIHSSVLHHLSSHNIS